MLSMCCLAYGNTAVDLVSLALRPPGITICACMQAPKIM